MRPWISEMSAGFTGRSFTLTSTSEEPTSGFWTSWTCMIVALSGSQREQTAAHVLQEWGEFISYLQAIEALRLPFGQLDSFVLV